MGDKHKVSFQCDECGHPYEVSQDRLLIPGEELEFHVGVSKRCHPVNYCRMCLGDKLRLLADEILESWPDFVVG